MYPDLFARAMWCEQKQLALLKQFLQLRQYEGKPLLAALACARLVSKTHGLLVLRGLGFRVQGFRPLDFSARALHLDCHVPRVSWQAQMGMGMMSMSGF